jgi:hypothetical protein
MRSNVHLNYSRATQWLKDEHERMISKFSTSEKGLMLPEIQKFRSICKAIELAASESRMVNESMLETYDLAREIDWYWLQREEFETDFADREPVQPVGHLPLQLFGLNEDPATFNVADLRYLLNDLITSGKEVKALNQVVESPEFFDLLINPSNPVVAMVKDHPAVAIALAIKGFPMAALKIAFLTSYEFSNPGSSWTPKCRFVARVEGTYLVHRPVELEINDAGHALERWLIRHKLRQVAEEGLEQIYQLATQEQS